MHRPTAHEFLLALLRQMDDLPPDFGRRFEELLRTQQIDRAQALRKLFEDFGGG
jgi:hypothetical protein